MSEDSSPPAFGSVFLALVGIVVALGIEQLLGHVTAEFATAAGVSAFLVVAQGVTMFLVIGAIWTSYATQVMVGPWEPRFQDFFLPLFILSLLYFSISAIGSGGPEWFYLAAVGNANAAIGQQFGLPRATAARLKPNSPEGRRAILSLAAISLLGFGGGIAIQTGVMGDLGATALVCILAAVVLLQTWFAFQWWRSV